MGSHDAPAAQRNYWAIPIEVLLEEVRTSRDGLAPSEAARRLALYGRNHLRSQPRSSALLILLGQFRSPISLILIVAAAISAFLRDPTDAAIILAIIALSGLLGFWQERGAHQVVARLLQTVQIKAMVRRAGTPAEIPIEETVPGDLVLLSAGDTIPGDCRLLEGRDLHASESVLTGETFPVEKTPETLSSGLPLTQRRNCLFMGTHVISGTGTAVIVATGMATEFGRIAERLRIRPPETEFERGVRRFGYFLVEVTLLLVVAIFAVNVFLNRPVLEAFLFTLALAVGLTPQLLPVIIGVNLAQGAHRMARKGVIVKRLAVIENLGSMDILCSDKTGTLTEGNIRLRSAIGVAGDESEKVLLYAAINAAFQSGFKNPIDQAIQKGAHVDLAPFAKIDEVPYDFIRKRLSVIVQGERRMVITKGALPNVLAACSAAETDAGIVALESVAPRIEHDFEALSAQGYRVLGVAYRVIPPGSAGGREVETDMTFLGLLVFEDPPKERIKEALAQLAGLGIALKIISGDNRHVASRLARDVGVAEARVLTGPEIGQMSDEALMGTVERVGVFAEIEPNQKERIVLALRKLGHVVGFMGDGINDTPAFHAADVSISVDQAVDVAKEAADIVLLERDLGVLAEGAREGRVTFANTLKYVFMATSANFGNMFSMAGASLFLPFLPLLPKQILLTNLLTDIPETTIATDSVDAEMVRRPRRWDVRFIRRFMLTFGLLSTVFDFATFGVLLLVLGANTEHFRAGWFVESVVSASAIVLVIRSRRWFFRSRPGKYLVLATIGVVIVAVLLPYTALGRLFGFDPMPAVFLGFLAGIVLAYMVLAEGVKRWFYRDGRAE